MDGTADHSDSDSGESWILLEPSPAHADEVPEFPENIPNDRFWIDDKDEDTDGISIISDSDPEPPLLGELTEEHYLNQVPTGQRKNLTEGIQYMSFNPLPKDDSMLQETISAGDNILGENSGKQKTYVHKRNKRLSTVLNIIVLGSVITAAGVAIGHMWGIKNDCSINSVPSVNKILSNLYKLQEENAYLRSKLKEMTLLCNMNFQQRKSSNENISVKQNKCKRVFEEPIPNKYVDKPIKCVDGETESKKSNNQVESEGEDIFLPVIDKLKFAYKEIKTWLDDEIIRNKKKLETQNVNNKGDIYFGRYESAQIDHKYPKGELSYAFSEQTKMQKADLKSPSPFLTDSIIVKSDSEKVTSNPKKPKPRKISYADSLKSEDNQKTGQTTVSNFNIVNNNTNQHHKIEVRKEKYDQLGYTSSEEIIKKDDRYMLKYKKDRKKYDRQKQHKKQKRKNKYEQWEMKGGYLKDFDDLSTISTQDDAHLPKKTKDILDNHFEPKSNGKANESNLKSFEKGETTCGKKGEKSTDDRDSTWFEKRASFRNELRKKIIKELFDETSPNRAKWYFRRMKRREQILTALLINCYKLNNSTHKKLSKQHMNFKTKQ